MDEQCWCGNRLGHAYESWVCGRCERPCCPSCAEHDGAAATCVGCHRPRPSFLAA